VDIDFKLYANTIECLSEDCPLRKECANHYTAGDFRSEGGMTPALRFVGHDDLECTQKDSGVYEGLVLLNEMVQYTKEQLIAALVALQPTAEDNLREVSWQLPLICTAVAGHCWVNQIPEDKNTHLVRRALKDLTDHGQFNYPL
jgi:hypothetical protein